MIRPILFSGPMIRALLDGRKTQTRRVLKPQLGALRASPFVQSGIEDTHGREVRVKYERGDLLWVRETWGVVYEEYIGDADEPVFWRADYSAEDIATSYLPRWRPSIHMPRWASRLTLEVTDVRVQRLQEISEGDAAAEGVERDSDGWRDYLMPSTQCCGNARDSFATLWSSINEKRGFGWDVNPWVVAITFRVIHENINALIAAREAALREIGG